MKTLVEGVTRFLEANEYRSLGQAMGSMSLSRCPDPTAVTRVNYMYILQNWEKALVGQVRPK